MSRYGKRYRTRSSRVPKLLTIQNLLLNPLFGLRRDTCKDFRTAYAYPASIPFCRTQHATNSTKLTADSNASFALTTHRTVVRWYGQPGELLGCYTASSSGGRITTELLSPTHASARLRSRLTALWLHSTAGSGATARLASPPHECSTDTQSHAHS